MYRNAIGLYNADALRRAPMAALTVYPQTTINMGSFYAAAMKNYIDAGIYRFNLTPEEYCEMDRSMRERLMKLSEEATKKIAGALPNLGGLGL